MSGPWLFSTNHRRIGLMYLFASTLALILGGVFALMIRTELWTPAPLFLDPGAYDRVFTLHGAVMVFLFIVPAIPAALGNIVLPPMLGLPDMALPRANRLSFHLYILGALLLLTAMYASALNGGSGRAILVSATGVLVIGVSSILVGINIIVTLHKSAPKWWQLPPFVWTLYLASTFSVLTIPTLTLTQFVNAAGIQPIALPQFYWIYGHPAVYIMSLPALGVVSEVVAAFSKRQLVGQRVIILSSGALTMIALGLWGYEMFQGPGTSSFGPAYLAAGPAGAIILCWLTSLARGMYRVTSPILYALAFIWLVALGGVHAFFPELWELDAPQANSYFAVAHFHLVVVGGTLTALLAGLHYWWPLICARSPLPRLSILSYGLVIAGFHGTFFPQIVLGASGMQRRAALYQPDLRTYNQVSTVGAFTLGLGLLLALISLAWPVVFQRPTTTQESPNAG